jgi:hypothetical protein
MKEAAALTTLNDEDLNDIWKNVKTISVIMRG